MKESQFGQTLVTTHDPNQPASLHCGMNSFHKIKTAHINDSDQNELLDRLPCAFIVKHIHKDIRLSSYGVSHILRKIIIKNKNKEIKIFFQKADQVC